MDAGQSIDDLRPYDWEQTVGLVVVLGYNRLSSHLQILIEESKIAKADFSMVNSSEDMEDWLGRILL
jgi:hypothetical protein